MLETNLISPQERSAFLNNLFKMCYRQRSLPTPMVIKHPQNVAELAECGGGSADVYRGECGGRLVAVKFIRICLRDDRGLELSVGTPFRALREKTADPDTHRDSVEKPSLGGICDIQTSCRCLARRWTYRHQGSRWCQNGWITATSTITSRTTEK